MELFHRDRSTLERALGAIAAANAARTARQKDKARRAIADCRQELRPHVGRQHAPEGVDNWSDARVRVLAEKLVPHQATFARFTSSRRVSS
jgi:hypothetical protein